MMILLSLYFCFGGCIYRAREAVPVCPHDPTISSQVMECVTVILKLHSPSRGRVGGYIWCHSIWWVLGHVFHVSHVQLEGNRGYARDRRVQRIGPSGPDPI